MSWSSLFLSFFMVLLSLFRFIATTEPLVLIFILYTDDVYTEKNNATKIVIYMTITDIAYCNDLYSTVRKNKKISTTKSFI